MEGIDEVLERLVTDGDFRAALARDPAAALVGYDLTREDAELLAGRLDDAGGAERAVEQRSSKSAMLSLLSAVAELGVEAGPGEPAVVHEPDLLDPTDDAPGQSGDHATGKGAGQGQGQGGVGQGQGGGAGQGQGGGAGEGPGGAAEGPSIIEEDPLSWSWGEANADLGVVGEPVAGPAADDVTLYGPDLTGPAEDAFGVGEEAPGETPSIFTDPTSEHAAERLGIDDD